MQNIMKSGLFVFIICLLSAITSCEKNNSDNKLPDPGDPVNIPIENYQKEVIDSANGFAFDIFSPILKETKGNENILISPFSISSALSMTLNGAAGETFDAIQKALGFDGKSLEQINDTYLKLISEMVPVDELVTLEVANSVWVEKRLNVKEKFMTDLKTWYDAEARKIDVTDPNAVSTVNDWISEKTHEKITHMLDNLDPDLAMLLINAIYFNGKWRYQFDKADTNEEPFYLAPGSPKNVPMMHQSENLKCAKTDNLTLVDLPYGQGNFSMLVVLPDDGFAISDIDGALTSSNWTEWMELLENNTHKVELSMPKFKYGYKRLLNDDLIKLGMGIAFSDLADFSNISDQWLQINRVIHQSFIETTEEGTEAAAATVVEITLTSAGPDPEPQVWKINVDHPFLYFIHETSTGTLLFMGKVGDPTVN
jgi:serine protease inhibitor